MSAAWFHYNSIALKLAYNRNKLFKTWHYWPRDMLNFDILDEGLGIVSAAHFVYNLSKKCSSSNVLLTAQISLPLLLEIFCNMCIAIVCWPGYDVINFKTTLIFLIKPFLYMTKSQDENLYILRTKRASKVK